MEVKAKKYKERLTPIMGWSSWNNYRIHISESLIKKQMDALISTGLAEVGYDYCNVDDGFFYGRDNAGYLRIHPERFPDGVKVISEYAHSKGLHAGIYSEGGSNTCAHIYDNSDGNSDGVGVGLYGYDEQDLRQYLIEWDFDFIKVDWCGGLRMGLSEQERYTKIGNIIEELREEKGRDIIYNVCRWQFPGEWVTDVADSWRVSADIELNFESILKQIDDAKELAKYSGPGHVNDLDMLQVGRGMTYIEDQTHFAMWCMMASPLMLGNDLTTITEATLSILKNTELIAINQDEGCVQAEVIQSGEAYEVYSKALQNGGKAIAILNRGSEPLYLDLNWSDLGHKGVKEIRDVIEHQNRRPDTICSIELPVHGVAVYVIEA